jgi:O-antigen/teichoic acid export membrane protein
MYVSMSTASEPTKLTGDAERGSAEVAAPGGSMPPADAGHNQHMGSKVRKGLFWMFARTGLDRSLALISQVILGWLLSDNDFGVYAIAFAIVGLCTFLREGGSRDYLIQKGPDKFHEHVGPIFWMSGALTAIVCGVLAGAAFCVWRFREVLPEAYQDPRLPHLLLIGCAVVTASLPASISSAKLQGELRFGDIGRISLISGVLRFVGLVGLALAGFGPYSFVLAALLVAIYESVQMSRLTKLKLLSLSPQMSLWPSYLSVTGWLILGVACNFINEYGSSSAVGLKASQDVVGQFYWAYVLTFQIASAYAVNVNWVLMPALSRLNDDKQRQSAAIANITKLFLLGGCVLSFGFAVVAEPLITMVWKGRWDSAVMAVQVFAIFMPIRMTFSLTKAILQAQGSFRQWSQMSFVESVLLFAAAACGAWYLNQPEYPTLFIGLTFVATRWWITSTCLKAAGVKTVQRLRTLFYVWLLGLGVVLGIMLLDHHVTQLGWWMRVQNVMYGQVQGLLAHLAFHGLRCVVLGVVFCVIFAITLRVLCGDVLQTALGMAPVRLRGVLGRVMLMGTRS